MKSEPTTTFCHYPKRKISHKKIKKKRLSSDLKSAKSTFVPLLGYKTLLVYYRPLRGGRLYLWLCRE